MQKTNSTGAAELEKLEALKKRAAKQAAKRELAPEEFAQVTCTVLPMGDGKISMGEHIAGLGTAHYEEGETFTVEAPIAVALYRRGFVNFPDAKEVVATFQKQLDAERAADMAEKAAFDKAMNGVSI